jgi:SulP family sulfate permease
MSIFLAAIDLPQIISLSTLLYSNSFPEYIGIGIGAGIFGATIVHLFITFYKKSIYLYGGPQDSPIAILSISVAAISAGMSGASRQAGFATVFMLVMITSIFTGILFILIGRFNLNRFLRLVPYPVIGGFVAGTGLLLFTGGIGVMARTTVEMSNLHLLFTSSELIRWVPGLTLGVLVLIVNKKFNGHHLITPIALIVSLLLFYAWTFSTGLDIENLQKNGWLLGPFPSGTLWQPITPSMMLDIRWDLILNQSSNILAASIMSAIALMLNLSALELVLNKDIDNRNELILMGTANIIGGLGGSSVSYHYFGISSLGHAMKTTNKMGNFIYLLMLGSILLVGASILSYIPTFLVGGLLIFLGLDFLFEWVIYSWRRLPMLDYFLVITIVLVIGWVGFLQGVGVGLLGAVLSFVINYGRIDIVKDNLDGTKFHSNVERPQEHIEVLQNKGSQIRILLLQGYLFFGTTQSLLDRIREQIQNQKKEEKICHIILDFHRVSALDFSAVIGLKRIHQLTRENGITLILTELNNDMLAKLHEEGLLPEDENASQKVDLQTFQNLDYGMEWCENKLIMEDTSSTILRAATLEGQLKKAFPGGLTQRFIKYLEKINLNELQVLIMQGDEADCMYIIESGEVAVHIEVTKGKYVRLRSMRPGTMVGELGMFLNQKRNATVTAMSDSVVYKLTSTVLKEMETKEPDVALAFHKWIMLNASQKLADATQTMQTLSR